MGFVGGGGKLSIATALPIVFIVLLNSQTVYMIDLTSNFGPDFLHLTLTSMSGCGDAASCSCRGISARGILFLLSAEYSAVMSVPVREP